MAAEDPTYLQWLRASRCACQPCVSPAEPHHSTNGSTVALRESSSGKQIGGRRGKGQRCNDDQAFPLCARHHRQFHDLSGPFRDWTKQLIRAWQDEQVRIHRARYEAELEQNPSPAPATADAPQQQQPTARGRDWWTSGANDERAAIARVLRAAAAAARLAPDAAAVLNDHAELLEERAEPIARRPTQPRPGPA